MAKTNIVGGATAVADNNLRQLEQFSLDLPGGGYFFMDSAIYHSVSTMRSGLDDAIAYRDIFSVDFEPVPTRLLCE